MPIKEQTAKRRSLGLCIVCGKLASPDKSSCQKCLDRAKSNSSKYYEANRLRYTRLKEEGLCVKCGRDKGDSKTLDCAACKKKYKNKSALYLLDPINVGAKDAYNKALYLSKAEVILQKQKVAVRDRKVLVMNYYGGVCTCCGEDGIAFLQLDHIHGNGAQHRRELDIKGGGGTSMYRWIIKEGFPSNFQVLCCNCNFAKRDGAYCPHQVDRVSQAQMSLFDWRVAV